MIRDPLSVIRYPFPLVQRSASSSAQDLMGPGVIHGLYSTSWFLGLGFGIRATTGIFSYFIFFCTSRSLLLGIYGTLRRTEGIVDLVRASLSVARVLLDLRPYCDS